MNWTSLKPTVTACKNALPYQGCEKMAVQDRTPPHLESYYRCLESPYCCVWGAVCLKITLGVDVYDRMRYLAPQSIFSECLCLRSIVSDLAIDVYLPFITGSRCLRQDTVFSSTVYLALQSIFIGMQSDSIFSDQLTFAIDI